MINSPGSEGGKWRNRLLEDKRQRRNRRAIIILVQADFNLVKYLRESKIMMSQLAVRCFLPDPIVEMVRSIPVFSIRENTNDDSNLLFEQRFMMLYKGFQVSVHSLTSFDSRKWLLIGEILHKYWRWKYKWIMVLDDVMLHAVNATRIWTPSMVHLFAPSAIKNQPYSNDMIPCYDSIFGGACLMCVNAKE
ncbi:hypothetical protein LXL04_033017 [Taraxacum kok-saghyz]